MGDNPGRLGKLVECNLVVALAAEDDHFVAYGNLPQVRHVGHGHVHRHGTNQWRALTANEYPPAVAAGTR